VGAGQLVGSTPVGGNWSIQPYGDGGIEVNIHSSWSHDCREWGTDDDKVEKL